ncbi:hypothetical protein [Clostridium uliginosum]|uniref:DUF3899 domain-containing protein n=1 Tax=Clostridium uliginosum TaxID=119641 RepID=A0A1I1JSK6_9CLOT|nr:hypothetical protein [Clostridium uliginosum]SFC50932.1 hypothetical protein SAMN05421842_104133 [Clostridium uliginosum]
MKKIKIFKFIFALLIAYLSLAIISLIATYFFSFTLKDAFFIIGLMAFIIELLLNFSGNSMGLSIQSFGNLNSQYVSHVDLKAKQHENENYKPEVNIKAILNSTLFFSSIFILITSYFL